MSNIQTTALAASFGEKSNPVEVRLDPDACRLYVKANGSPVFTDRPPLWLLEYDLLRRTEVQSAKVEPQAVPATCARTLDSDQRGFAASVRPEIDVHGPRAAKTYFLLEVTGPSEAFRSRATRPTDPDVGDARRAETAVATSKAVRRFKEIAHDLGFEVRP